ncbi:endo alpha-1,4 polygalactosaminidase [Microbacterium sp.]|uniref:endo alpha-1,4 polygalactosaminidase n=1 Tax=Microbacterium sp. TaxID=51671 RepID=UPI0039E45DA2
MRTPHRRKPLLTATLTAAALVLAGCTDSTATTTTATPTGTAPPAVSPGTAAPVTLPPVGALPDYQLGGAYDPPDGVGVVVRDRTERPAAGIYSICYVNAFQTQPGEISDWPVDLLLREESGDVVFDPDWPDEAIIDTRDPRAVARFVAPWIEGCAASGFDAVEFDNLDTYTRTGGALTREDNVEVARLLVQAAHSAGLAAGQKNAAEDAPMLRTTAGFDFAVVEECSVYDECGTYAAVYGDHVIAIEYPDALTESFAVVCASAEAPRSLILRDRDLTSPESDDYVFVACTDAR